MTWDYGTCFHSNCSHVNQRTSYERPTGPPRKNKMQTIDPFLRTASRKYIYEATSYALSHVKPAREAELEEEIRSAIAVPVNHKPVSAPVCQRLSLPFNTDFLDQVPEVPVPQNKPGFVLRELQVRVPRSETGGFGFTVTGGAPKPVVVYEVLQSYPAHGILEREDVIVRVNDRFINGMPHDAVLDLFAGLPPSKEAVFTIQRYINGLLPFVRCYLSADSPFSCPVNTVNPPLPAKSVKKPSQAADGIRTVTVEIEHKNGSFDFELSSSFPPHVVATVKPGGHAEQKGLKNGDILAFIGSVDVQRMSQEELLDYLISSTADSRVAKALVFRNGIAVYFLLAPI